MKQRSLVSIAISFTFLLVFTLALVSVPADVVSANQMSGVQSQNVKPKYGVQENTSNAKAIQTLKDLIDAGLQTSGIYLSLGDLYSQAGMNNLAEDYYQKSIKQVLANKDIEVLIAAKTRLADIKDRLAKPEEANRLRQEAEALEEAYPEGDHGREPCGECKTTNGENGYFVRIGTTQTCKKCSPG